MAENRILKAHLQPRYRLPDSERATLAEIAKRLRRKALEELSPGALGIIGLRGGFLLHRDELIAELFRLTPDFLF